MAKMNPNYPGRRGCWIEKTTDGDGNAVKFTLHDYPAWRLGNGDYVGNTLDAEPPPGFVPRAEFADYASAKAFAAEENYVVCDRPKTAEERAEIAARYGGYADDSDAS